MRAARSSWSDEAGSACEQYWPLPCPEPNCASGCRRSPGPGPDWSRWRPAGRGGEITGVTPVLARPLGPLRRGRQSRASGSPGPVSLAVALGSVTLHSGWRGNLGPRWPGVRCRV
jgi:hypothetical protein